MKVGTCWSTRQLLLSLQRAIRVSCMPQCSNGSDLLCYRVGSQNLDGGCGGVVGGRNVGLVSCYEWIHTDIYSHSYHTAETDIDLDVRMHMSWDFGIDPSSVKLVHSTIQLFRGSFD